MLGSCVVDSPNGSIDCHKEVNSTKKTIDDFFSKSSQNNPSSIKKPKNLLGYFSKDTNHSHNSHVSDNRTDASVGSLVLEELPQVPAKNKVVKKNLLKKNPTASSSDKNSSNASSLDKKRKRANKQVLSADEDFVENAQPKRFKSKDGILSEESNTNTNTSLPSNEPLSEKTPQNISNIKLKIQFDKIVDQNIDHCDAEDDFISKKDASLLCNKVLVVVGCKNDQQLSKRKYNKKNSKNDICSSDKNEMLKKKSKLKSSKNQQSNVGKVNELNKYYSEKEKKEPSNNCEKEKIDSDNFCLPNPKEISPSDACNGSTNSELNPPSLTDLNTKSDLAESCQSLNIQACENSEVNAMELSYEEFLLSETVNEEDSTNLESAKTSPEKASPSKSDVHSVKKDISDSQKVTVVADIHSEPSLNVPTANAINNSSKSADAVLKNVSSEVIKPKHQDIDDIVVLDTELLNKANEIPAVIDDASHNDQQKETTSSLDIITKKANPKSKPIPKSKKQRSLAISNSTGVKCSQSTLNFEQGNLDLNSKSNSAILVEKSKGTPKTDSKPSKIATKVIEQKASKSIHKKNQQRDLVKYKGKNSLNSAKRNKNHKMPAVLIQPKKLKNKISKKIKKKSERISTKSSVPKDVKKTKVPPHENKTIEVTEVKNSSTAPADGNSKDNLNLSKLDNIEKLDLKEISSPMTRKSLRLQERKAAPTSSDDLEMLVEVPTPKEKENKVSSKTTLYIKEKCLNNEKAPQKGGKLAPIFMKNSNKKECKKSTELETEEDRLRRAFLMSGLPEEAKRQHQATNNTVSAVSCDHAPFPRDSHVQQVEPSAAEINPWDLPEVNLPLTKVAPAEAEGNNTVTPPPWDGSFGVITETPTSNARVDHLKKFSNHSPLLASETKTILREISAANPSYPVHHFYEMALKRNKVAEKNEKNPVKSEIGKEVANVKNTDATTEENQKGKRKIKRSLGCRKGNKKSMVTDSKNDCQKPEKIDANSEERVCDILWTEKYQPLHSSEIICNSSNVKKLKSWLLEWKQRTDREARKLKKLLMKQKISKKSKEEDSNSTLSWNDDESDFALSPSESEEDSLCNTKLLTGPQGIGKTASVYALAMELGYQVFEMNASSIRSGKKILTRLQEATQSHQVRKDKYDLTVSPQQSTDFQSVPQKNLVVPSFSTFFKTSLNKTASGKISKTEKGSLSTCVPGKVANNKRKKNQKDILPAKNTIPRCVLRKSPETGSWKKIDLVDSNLNSSLSSSVKVSNRLNIASTSLILFDEVDIVFEEDKGFWTAILQFMSSTKRPIILTATSADFSEQFIGSCEPLHFHTPSTKTLTSHLQTLCLAENVVTKASEISDLVTYYSSDVRSCLLALQFWVDSGASGIPVNIPLSHISRSNLSSLIDNNNKSETDAIHIENTEKVTDKQEKQLELKGDNVSKQEFAAHLYFLESYLAINPHQLQFLHLENVTSETSIDANQLDTLARACQHCYPQNFYLCHQIFLSRLCSPQAAFPSFDLSLRALKKKVTKPDVPDIMQKLKSDLYDSETSCDDFICQTLEQKSCTTDEKGIKPAGNCSEEPVVICKTVEDNILESNQNQKTPPLSNLDENSTPPSQVTSSWKSLRGIAKFYDCCSDIDIFLTSCCLKELSANPNAAPRSINSYSSLSPGLWDEFPIVSNELRYSQTFTDQALDIAANRELRSYLKYRQDTCLPTSADDLKQPQQNTSTSTYHRHYSGFVKPQPQDRTLSSARQKAVENVIHNLPVSHSLQANLLFLDYFPTLRNICRTEKVRQLAKLKRRFFHYFDNINLPLKESTLNILSSDFL